MSVLSAPSSPRSRAGPSTVVVGCQCFFQCRHSRVAQAFYNGCRRWSDWPCQWPSGYLRAAQQCCLPDTGTCSCQLYCIGSDNGCGIGCAMILGNFIAMRFIRNVNKKLYQKVVAGIMIAVSLWLIVSQII